MSSRVAMQNSTQASAYYVLPIPYKSKNIHNRCSLCEEARLRPLGFLGCVMEVLRHVHHSLYVIVAQPFAALAPQQLCSLQDVLDLASVHIEARQSVNILRLHSMRQSALAVELQRRLVDLRCRSSGGAAVRLGGGGESLGGTAISGCGLSFVVLPEKVVPYFLPALGIQLGVVEADVDAALECGVERLHSVRGQEHDAFVVFEHAQKDRDEFVALQLMEATLFEEYIGFILLQVLADTRRHQNHGLTSSRMAFHLVHISRMPWSLLSTWRGSRPRSPALIMYSGTFISSATDSAVSVLPTPGGPLQSCQYHFFRNKESLRHTREGG